MRWYSCRECCKLQRALQMGVLALRKEGVWRRAAKGPGLGFVKPAVATWVMVCSCPLGPPEFTCSWGSWYPVGSQHPLEHLCPSFLPKVYLWHPKRCLLCKPSRANMQKRYCPRATPNLGQGQSRWVSQRLGRGAHHGTPSSRPLAAFLLQPQVPTHSGFVGSIFPPIFM